MNKTIDRINRSKRFKNREMTDNLKLLLFLTYGEEGTREKAALTRINKSHLFGDRKCNDRIRLTSLLDLAFTPSKLREVEKDTEWLLMQDRPVRGLKRLLNLNSKYRLANTSELLEFVNSSNTVFSDLYGKSFWTMDDGKIRAITLLNKESVTDVTCLSTLDTQLKSLLRLKERGEETADGGIDSTEDVCGNAIEISQNLVSFSSLTNPINSYPLFTLEDLKTYRPYFVLGDLKHTLFWCLNEGNIVVWMPHSNSYRNPTDHDRISLVTKLGGFIPKIIPKGLGVDTGKQPCQTAQDLTSSTPCYLTKHLSLRSVNQVGISEQGIPNDYSLATLTQLKEYVANHAKLPLNNHLWAVWDADVQEIIPKIIVTEGQQGKTCIKDYPLDDYDGKASFLFIKKEGVTLTTLLNDFDRGRLSQEQLISELWNLTRENI